MVLGWFWIEHGSLAHINRVVCGPFYVFMYYAHLILWFINTPNQTCSSSTVIAVHAVPPL